MSTKSLIWSSSLMVWFIITFIFSAILDIITFSCQSTLEKDLEILVLRQQLTILQRKLSFPIRPNRVEKLTLSALTLKLKQITNRTTNQLRSLIYIFQPETVLRWHRELVRKNGLFIEKAKVVDHLSVKNLRN